MRRLRDTDFDDDRLRKSLEANGWVSELPAIMDEHGVVLIGERRVRIAGEIGIEPVIRRVEFGAGAEVDVARVRLAMVSNAGGVAMSPNERRRLANHLFGLAWTQQATAYALGVSQRQIKRDVNHVDSTAKPKRGRPAKPSFVPRKAARNPEFDFAAKPEKVASEPPRPKPVPAWKMAVGVSPPRELTGKPGPGSSIEEHNAYDEEYGRTPLHPKVVMDLTRAARRVSSLTECVAGVERADRPTVEGYLEAVEAMLAYVPDKDQTDGRENDYAAEARKSLSRMRKALPGALTKLQDLEDRLRRRDGDKVKSQPVPEVVHEIVSPESEIMRPAWARARP